MSQVAWPSPAPPVQPLRTTPARHPAAASLPGLTFDQVISSAEPGILGRRPTPGSRLVCTFSNRVFPTKAIRGWLAATDEDRCAIAAEYFRRSGAFGPPTVSRRSPLGHPGDPLFAVWATRT